MPITLEMTPELITLIQHLEAASASPLGLRLKFDSNKDLEIYKRKCYIAKRKVWDSKQGDFSNISLRISDDDDATLYLVKEEKGGTGG